MKQRLYSLVAAVIISLAFILGLSSPAQAYPYGEGDYGECAYGGQPSDDALSFTVNTASVDLGEFTSTATGTGTATFSAALNCSDDGYVVQITGDAPASGSHTIDAMASSAASATGTEQYGINLVDNTSPNIGANPSGGSGQAATGYDTANLFKYVDGQTIAESATNSTQTDYTISFIINAASDTPAGDYSTSHNLTITATF